MYSAHESVETSLKIYLISDDTYRGKWRFVYNGDWATDGKNGWQPDSQIEE